jgi:cell division transport system ATP-binding protein
MIQFFHVYKRYGNGIEACKDLTFQIEPGEFVFVTGPSGAGKTTFIRLMLMIEDISEGEVLIQGRNLRRLKNKSIPYLRRNIGVVFQDFKLIPTRTIFDNVALSLEILGIPYHEVKKRVGQMLEQVGLEKYADHFPPMLSGGEQQRVAIARALVNDPMIVVADEPTGNLDPDLALEIMDIFYELHKRGTTVIVATHDRYLLERFSARAILLNRGFIIQDTKQDTKKA